MNAENLIEMTLEAEYGGYQAPVARRVARELDDAGLLTWPLPGRDEIEQAVHDSADFLDWETCLEIADAVLDLLEVRDR